MDFVNKIAQQAGGGDNKDSKDGKSSGGGDFMDKINNAAGGGAQGEKNEDGLDKGEHNLYGSQPRIALHKDLT